MKGNILLTHFVGLEMTFGLIALAIMSKAIQFVAFPKVLNPISKITNQFQ